MRPAYEAFIEAIKKDLNRVNHYEWREVYAKLMQLATKEEKKYLKTEFKKLSYDVAEVELGKLVLGIRDADNDEAVRVTERVTHHLGLGRGWARQSGQTPQFVPTMFESSSPIPKEPEQMELDL